MPDPENDSDSNSTPPESDNEVESLSGDSEGELKSDPESEPEDELSIDKSNDDLRAARDEQSSAKVMRHRLGRPQPVGYDSSLTTHSSLISRTAMVVLILAVVAVLWVGKPLLLPLVIATLLAFLLAPMCDRLERRGLPRAAATTIMVIFAGVVVFGVAVAVYRGVSTVLGDGEHFQAVSKNLDEKLRRVPVQGESSMEKLDELTKKLEKSVGGEDELATSQPATQPSTEPATQTGDSTTLLTTGNDGTATPAQIESTDTDGDGQPDQTTITLGSKAEKPLFVQLVETQNVFDRLSLILSYIAGPMGMVALAVIFLLFMLLQRDDVRDRVIKLAAGQQINLATQALDDAAKRIARYLTAQCIVNGTYGLAIGIALVVIGYLRQDHLVGDIDGGTLFYPGVVVWALLCFALRFIPYLGPWLAAAFPIFVSVAFYDDWTTFIIVGSVFVVIELISNNVMEPMLYGSAVGMSDLAVIVAASFWTFIWGPEGLLVATPLTTVLVVLGKYVPGLSFFDTLLGAEPVLSPPSRLYQRLLALDAEDAEEVVEEYRTEHTLTETFDDLVLPALSMSEVDREAGNLTTERADFVRKAMKDLVFTLGDQREPLPSDSVDASETAELPENVRRARVMVLPAADAADETVADMLKHLLDRRGFNTTVLDYDALASEKLEATKAQRADVVVISALPPRALARARYLVKRLEACDGFAGNASVVVGLWGVEATEDKIKRRLCGDTGKNASDSAKRIAANLMVARDLGKAGDVIRQRAAVVVSRRAAMEQLDTSETQAVVESTS